MSEAADHAVGQTAGQLAFWLITPTQEVFAGEVTRVDVPGREGDFGVLPEHAPFVANLRAGVLQIRGTRAAEYFVFGGFAEVSATGLSVLTPQLVLMADMDGARAQAELRKAEAMLAETPATQQRAQLEQLVEALRALNTH